MHGPGDAEGLAARPSLRDELLQDHLLRFRVVVKAVENLTCIHAEHVVGHGLPVGVELGPKKVPVLLPHLACVHVGAVVQERNPLIELHELHLLENPVPVEVMKLEELQHEFLDALHACNALGRLPPPFQAAGLRGQRVLALVGHAGEPRRCGHRRAGAKAKAEASTGRAVDPADTHLAHGSTHPRKCQDLDSAGGRPPRPAQRGGRPATGRA
mmetsp:Transcript_97433/g.302996  ORF Transcript_97433/g.302996 Transcript_97433/m.302996 type:complete len:213 (-) Transcript_97433:9-647(-)